MSLEFLRRLRDSFTPRRFAIALIVLAALSAVSAAASPLAYRWLLSGDRSYLSALSEAGVGRLVRWFVGISIVSCAALLIALWLMRRRSMQTLGRIRWLMVPAYVWVGFYIFLTVRIIDLVYDLGLPVRDSTLDLVWAAKLKWIFNGPALLVAAALSAVHMITWSPGFIAKFAPRPLDGDVAAAHKKIRQDDPVFRSSVVTSVVAHVGFILILPWLLQTRGCMSLEYALPGGAGGGGGGGVQQPQVVKIMKKPTPKRKFIFRTNAAITFRVPKLDDSQVAEVVEQLTENEYVANMNPDEAHGEGGEGSGFGAGGGKGGGWPGGKDGAPVRFIRLQYSGEKWDDGMDASSRADVNFLEELRKAAGINVARQSESITAAQLRAFRRGVLPPFIFMTGEGSINMPDGDIKAVRQYLLDGGMIFADCGSPQWHNSFRDFLRRVLPDKPLLDISNDDQIFRTWFHFPNGAPPLWHHGGNRALGAKIDGRWAVFYFPGDMNDAWKTGHNDANPAAVRQAYQLGVNVVKYAMDHYWALTKANQAAKK